MLALNISPVEMCGIVYFSAILLACVPFPAPGAPYIIIFIYNSFPFYLYKEDNEAQIALRPIAL